MLRFGEAALEHVSLALSTKRVCHIFEDQNLFLKPFTSWLIAGNKDITTSLSQVRDRENDVYL